jgi:hypothetical protein
MTTCIRTLHLKPPLLCDIAPSVTSIDTPQLLKTLHGNHSASHHLHLIALVTVITHVTLLIIIVTWLERSMCQQSLHFHVLYSLLSTQHFILVFLKSALAWSLFVSYHLLSHVFSPQIIWLVPVFSTVDHMLLLNKLFALSFCGITYLANPTGFCLVLAHPLEPVLWCGLWTSALLQPCNLTQSLWL